jgi:hypothetical protein
MVIFEQLGRHLEQCLSIPAIVRSPEINDYALVQKGESVDDVLVQSNWIKINYLLLSASIAQ